MRRALGAENILYLDVGTSDTVVPLEGIELHVLGVAHFFFLE